MTEALLGYPMHAWFAVGELVLAEKELLAKHPEEAREIRAERIKYIDSLEFAIVDNRIILESAYSMDTHSILLRLTFLELSGDS
jgi:hypothetical protein